MFFVGCDAHCRTVKNAPIFLASLAGEVDLTLCVKDGGVKKNFIKLFIKTPQSACAASSPKREPIIVSADFKI